MSFGRILVTGANGQLGGALKQTLAPLGEVVAPLRGELDLTSADSIRQKMREVQPRWIVNAAAHTAVDKAENEPELAFAINAEAPRIFAEEAKLCGAALIHFSTDYVFDGSKTAPYTESDPTAPLNVYGQSKLAGEQALERSGVPHFVFRTSWVYGAKGKNFLLSILRFAREREHLRIVADQHGAPTWSVDLARMTARVIRQVEQTVQGKNISLAEAAAPVRGIYHAGGSGETTWFGFASAAVEQLRRQEPGTKLGTVEAIPTSEYPTPAKRPLNSRLDCGKLERTFSYRMMDWHDSLAAVMAELSAR